MRAAVCERSGPPEVLLIGPGNVELVKSLSAVPRGTTRPSRRFRMGDLRARPRRGREAPELAAEGRVPAGRGAWGASVSVGDGTPGFAAADLAALAELAESAPQA
jgi:hypothetical protein